MDLSSLVRYYPNPFQASMGENALQISPLPTPTGSIVPFPSKLNLPTKKVTPVKKDTGLSFALQFYSDSASIQGQKIIFKGVGAEGILFEGRNESQNPDYQYKSHLVKVDKIFSDWKEYFPPDEADPNALINGFIDGFQRRFLTLSLSNPVQTGDELIFNYNLDQVEGYSSSQGYIEKWNQKGNLGRVSVTLDRIFNDL